MKKYTSSEFVTTKYGIYKAAQDIITSLPATIIGNGSNVSPWTIKGNMTVSAACGDKTANLFDKTATYETGNTTLTYTISGLEPNALYTCSTNFIGDTSKAASVYFNSGSTASNGVWYNTPKTSRANSDGEVLIYVRNRAISGSNPAIYTDLMAGTIWIMLNTGSTALPYEPYGYKIPILCGETTNTIYISEPLRKALDGSGLYDTIESSGVLTRRVDSSGDALATPTTEQIAVPTISTTAGAQAFNIDTTLNPSEVDLTYTGWHMYDDKKYSGSEWS